MAEPRFNNPYYWPPPPTMPGQLENLVLVDGIKEQVIAEKTRPPHLPPPASTPPHQALISPPSHLDVGLQGLCKSQQTPGVRSPSPTQPDSDGHARPASCTVTGRILGDVNLNLDDKAVIKARGLWEDWHLHQLINHQTRGNHFSGVPLGSRTGSLGSSDIVTPTTTTSSCPGRLSGAPTNHLISGLVSSHAMQPRKSIGSLKGLHGAPPKAEQWHKKIKAENEYPLSVVPYPVFASGTEQSCVAIATNEGKSYRCKVCPLTFFSKSDIQIHSKSHTEAKPHRCPHCTKTFVNTSYLAQHLRIHLGVKPYRCSFCEKRFCQLSHLQQHTRIHTGDRPYRCAQPGCEKAFTQLSNLQSHQRQHNKDKPFKCSNCFRAYLDSSSLQIHLSAHAIKNAKVYCCSTCGQTYTSETYLMKHMSKHRLVDHVVSHQSQHYRTESPSIPIRISLF